MVIRQQKDVNYTTEHRLLNNAANQLTPADLERAKLGDPQMPTTQYKVASVINCQIHTLVTGFTVNCLLARHLQDVSNAVKETAGVYSNIPDYKWQFSRNFMVSH